MSPSPFIQRMNALLEALGEAQSDGEKDVVIEQMAEALKRNHRGGWSDTHDVRMAQTGERDDR